VHVRLVGFAPIDTIFILTAGKPTESVFFLGKHAVQLDTVVSRSGRTAGFDTVTTRSGRPGTSGFQSFGLRQSKGFGKFIAQGSVIPNIEAPTNASPGAKEAIQRDKERDWGPAFDLNTIGVSTLAGVEIYRSAAEAQGGYGGDDAGCGLIVLWSWRAR